MLAESRQAKLMMFVGWRVREKMREFQVLDDHRMGEWKGGNHAWFNAPIQRHWDPTHCRGSSHGGWGRELPDLIPSSHGQWPSAAEACCCCCCCCWTSASRGLGTPPPHWESWDVTTLHWAGGYWKNRHRGMGWRRDEAWVSPAQKNTHSAPAPAPCWKEGEQLLVMRVGSLRHCCCWWWWCCLCCWCCHLLLSPPIPAFNKTVAPDDETFFHEGDDDHQYAARDHRHQYQPSLIKSLAAFCKPEVVLLESLNNTVSPGDTFPWVLQPAIITSRSSRSRSSSSSSSPIWIIQEDCVARLYI